MNLSEASIDLVLNRRFHVRKLGGQSGVELGLNVGGGSLPGDDRSGLRAFVPHIWIGVLCGVVRDGEPPGC